MTGTGRDDQGLRGTHDCAFRSVLDNSPDGVVVFDSRGQTLYANASYLEMSGAATEREAANALTRDFYARPERDMPVVMERLRSGSSTTALEVEVASPWQPIEWVELSIRRVELSDASCYVGSVRDVGKRKRLLLERERIISVQQAINEAILEGSLEEMSHSACHRLADLYGCDWVGVALLQRDDEGEFFRYRWSYRVPAEIETIRFARDGESSLTAFAAEHGYGVIDDYQELDEEAIPRRTESLEAKVRAVESVALRDRHGQLVGVLTLFSSKPGYFREGDNEISLSLAARDLANIIGAKQMEEEIRLAGITDSVTGLYNTRHFYRRLSEEMKRASRSGRPLTVMLFDLDNFKEYNDRAGHVAGDHLLRRIAEIVSTTLRAGSDLAFRYGGDEFVVLLPETDLNRAKRVAVRLRKQVRDIQDAEVSTSIGLAEYRGEASPEELVRRADRAMYQAKGRGKDRVVIDRPRRAQRGAPRPL